MYTTKLVSYQLNAIYHTPNRKKKWNELWGVGTNFFFAAENSSVVALVRATYF